MNPVLSLRLRASQAMTYGLATLAERTLLQAAITQPGIRGVDDLPTAARRALVRLEGEQSGTPASSAVRFDPHQPRGYHGRWGHGLLGDDGFDLISKAEGTFGDLEMGVDDAGDVRLAFEDLNGERQAMDLGGGEVRELYDALEETVRERNRFGTDGTGNDVVYDTTFGYDNAHKVTLLDNGLIEVAFAADEDDPPALQLDPPDGEEDDVQQVLDGLDDVINELPDDDAERASVSTHEVERRFNPNELRDPGGEGGGQWVSSPASAAKDVLKLAGKVDLGDGEHLAGTDKVSGDFGTVRAAAIESGGTRRLRLGIGNSAFGSRSSDSGPWRAAPSPIEQINAGRKKLRDEQQRLEAEYPHASPDRQSAIDTRLGEIDELGTSPEVADGFTAEISTADARRLHAAVAEALANGLAAQAKYRDYYDKRIGEEPDSDYDVFGEGVIHGQWADVAYRVDLDDLDVGVQVHLGAIPHDDPNFNNLDDLGGDELSATLDPAGAKRLLKMLDRLTGGNAVSRTHSADGGPADRAPAGPQKGGQFAIGGGRVGAKGGPSRQRRGGPGAATGAKKAAAPDPNLHFDGKSGTGYGVKGGDPRVRTLQAALNRLGLTDLHGQELAVDGRYGPRTTSSVKKLQKALGLPVDGKVTPELLKQASELKQLPQKPPRKPKVAPARPASHQTARRRPGHISTTVRSRILNMVARALGEHRFVDGVCVSCAPAQHAADDDAEAVRALVEALDEVMRLRHVRTEAGAKKYGVPIGSVIGGSSGHTPVHAPHVAKPSVRDASNFTNADKLGAAKKMYGSDESKWPKRVQQDAAKLRQASKTPPAKRPTRTAKPTLKDRLVTAIDDHLNGKGDGQPLAEFNREQLRKVAKERGVPLGRGESRESIAEKLINHARGGGHDEATSPRPKPHARPEGRSDGAGTGSKQPPKKATPATAPPVKSPAANRHTAVTGNDALKAAPVNNARSLQKLTTKLVPITKDGKVKAERDIADIGGGVSGGEARDALGDYCDQGYQYVNDALRLAEGDVSHLPEKVRKGIPGHYSPQRAERMVRGIDALMGQSKLKHNVVVWRGVTDPAASMPGWKQDGDNTGLEFVDHAYASTTVNETAARKFAGYGAGVKMNIHVPAGIGAVGIQNSQAGLRNERELLLQRGLRYRVVADRVVDGVRTIDVDVVPTA